MDRMRLILAVALASLGFATAEAAVTVSQRSPFAQGLWWNSKQPGSGFDLMSAGGGAMVVWYTYDAAGAPVWYTAQGSEAQLDTEWPLLRYRWSNGKATPQAVGTLKLSVQHAESATIDWTIGTARGTTAITPYLLSSASTGVEHSGLWFDPSNSGWGLTITEQGPFVGGALFTYDPLGEPTWAAGFERGTGGVELFRGRGSCPSCFYNAPVMESVGRLTFLFAGENSLTLRNATKMALATGASPDGARMTQLGRPASQRLADRTLARFDAASLQRYLKDGLPMVGYGAGCADFSASPALASTSFSATNLQEDGVDEASLVKTDGTYVYAYAGQGTYTSQVPIVRVARLDQQGASFRVIRDFVISGNEAKPMAKAGFFLREAQLVSVHGTVPYTCSTAIWPTTWSWAAGSTEIAAMDRGNPEAPAPKWRMQVDGHLVATRRIGKMLYVVTRSIPAPAGYSTAQQADRPRILAEATLEQMLPAWRVDGGPAQRVPAEKVFATPQAGTPVADMVTIHAIDLDALRVADVMAIAGPTETVYASASTLVVASSRVSYRTSSGALLASEPIFARTDLHAVGLAAGLQPSGSGTVEGHLGSHPDMASFRISEQQGLVRAVSSSDAIWGAASKNKLSVLRPSSATPGVLETVAELPNATRSQALGKPGEMMHATRFVGDRLYAVTFRMVDPLYVVDLADPADPRIAGSLSITGYSDYLHPLPNGFLLGFGKDAIPAEPIGDGQGAWYQGLQVALYDVRDAAKPREVDRAVIGKRGSASALLNHHHAFSMLDSPEGPIIGFPAQVNEGNPLYGSGPSATYGYSYSGLVRYRITGLANGAPKLASLPTMITGYGSGGYGGAVDGTAQEGRGILLPQGNVYVGAGKFWHQDALGGTVGPR